jgi:hypothetical protein
MARDYQKTKENKRKAAAKRHASSIARFVGRNGSGGDNTAVSTAPTGTAVTQDTLQNNVQANVAGKIDPNAVAVANKCDTPPEGEDEQADVAAEDETVRVRRIVVYIVNVELIHILLFYRLQGETETIRLRMPFDSSRN